MVVLDACGGTGFSKLSERESWVDTVKAGNKYFVTRNQSSLVRLPIAGCLLVLTAIPSRSSLHACFRQCWAPCLSLCLHQHAPSMLGTLARCLRLCSSTANAPVPLLIPFHNPYALYSHTCSPSTRLPSRSEESLCPAMPSASLARIRTLHA